MKHVTCGIAAVLLLLCSTSCDSGNGGEAQNNDISLECLPGTWVLHSYDTATRMSSGTHISTTTLDTRFTVTLYNDMLFTLAGEDTLLAEGHFALDISRLRLEMAHYTLYPGTDLAGIDETLVELITGHPLQMESLNENMLELSLEYSDDVTITALLRKEAHHGIAGKWQVTLVEGYTASDTCSGASLQCNADSTFTFTTGNGISVQGTYSYDLPQHHLTAIYDADTLQADAVCSDHSLRIAADNNDYVVYFSK